MSLITRPVVRPTVRGVIRGVVRSPAETRLDFINGNLSPRITGTRASSATYTDANGDLQTAATDVMRSNEFAEHSSGGVAQGFLVEEQRSNLCLRSSDFGTTWSKSLTTVTTNSTVSPDGTTNADSIFEQANTGEHFVRQTFTGLTANTVYTVSVFVKDLGGRNFLIRVLDTDNTGNGYSMNVSPSLGTVITAASSIGSGTVSSGSISSVGNGWYRVTLSGNAGATCTKYILDLFSISVTDGINFAGDITKGIILWGAQLELGAFPTSYIPTVAAAATRARDIATITDLSTINFNASEGSMVVEFVCPPFVSGFFPTAVALNDNTFNNRMVLFINGASGVLGFGITYGGVGQASLSSISLTEGAVYKAAFGWANNSFRIAVNGTGYTEDTSGSVPAVSQMQFGRQITGSYLNSEISKATYYPRQLSQAQLNYLSVL